MEKVLTLGIWMHWTIFFPTPVIEEGQITYLHKEENIKRLKEVYMIKVKFTT